MIKVKVSDVVEQMDLPGPGFTTYLNRDTGEFVTLSEEETRALETEDQENTPEWLQKMSPGLKTVALPASFEAQELAAMREFSRSVSDSRASGRLLDALDGEAAFRGFSDQLDDLGLADAWKRFRDESIERIAVEWLKENGIPYESHGVD